MKWFIALLFIFGGSHGVEQDVFLEIFPSGVWKIPEDTLHNLTLSLRFNHSDSSSSLFSSFSPYFGTSSEDLDQKPDIQVENRDPDAAILVVTVVLDEEWKLDFVNSSAIFTAQEVSVHVNKTLTFSGYYWGLSKLSFYLTRNDLDPHFSNGTLLRDDLSVSNFLLFFPHRQIIKKHVGYYNMH